MSRDVRWFQSELTDSDLRIFYVRSRVKVGAFQLSHIYQ
jgi:hypothetical protein